MAFSRREFLLRVGQAGGYGAAFATMQALGLMPMRRVCRQNRSGPRRVRARE